MIETLVAMVTGLVVAGTAFALLLVTLEQTSRATNYVQASQLGRTTMTHIVDELSSACAKYDSTPVLEKSTPEKLIFEDAFSEEAEIPNSQFQLHEIEWEDEPGYLTGKLFEYKAVGNATSGWGSKTKILLGSRIGKSGSEQIFRYYEYGTTTQASTESGVTPFVPITLSAGQQLTKTQAENVAAVQITFRAMPTDGKREEKLGQSLTLHSQVTFALTAPIAEPTITDEPCQ